jgi:membrane-bound lytic murein transglycosylase D
MNRWTKVHKAAALVRSETARIRGALLRLAKNKNFTHLKPGDRELIQSLAWIKGPRSKVFREAAKNLRTQLGQRDFFLSGLQSSSRYLPFIEKEFAASGLPTELTRLPFVESSFNVQAESKVGASGIWQIMPYTGREFLIVGNSIDERNSPFKSSLVAIELFRQNYRKFQSWPLAITAYNHGWEGLRDAIEETRSEDLAVLINKYHTGAFKFASANFYTCFLAALHAERYHKEIFKELPADYAPVDFKVVTLEKTTKARSLLKNLGISSDDLLTYNLDLKHAVKKNAALPKGYYLILPTRFDQALARQLSSRKRTMREADLRIHAQKNPGLM